MDAVIEDHADRGLPGGIRAFLKKTSFAMSETWLITQLSSHQLGFVEPWRGLKDRAAADLGLADARALQPISVFHTNTG